MHTQRCCGKQDIRNLREPNITTPQMTTTTTTTTSNLPINKENEQGIHNHNHIVPADSYLGRGFRKLCPGRKNVIVASPATYDYQSPGQQYRYLPIFHQTVEESVSTMFRSQRNNSEGSFRPKVRFGGSSNRKGNNNGKKTRQHQQMMSSSTNNNTPASFKNQQQQQLPMVAATETTPSSQPEQRRLPSTSTTQSDSNNNNKNALTNTRGFSQIEIDELKQSFDLFDVEGTGQVQISTVLNVLQELQQQSSTSSPSSIYPNLQQLIDVLSEHMNISNTDGINDDNNDVMEFQDYLQLMEMTTIHYKSTQSEDDDYTRLEHVFGLFDIDKKGYITLEDLQRIAIELGEEEMTKEELSEMIDRATAIVTVDDKDGGGITTTSKQKRKGSHKGKVTLEDFINMMTLDLFPKKRQPPVHEEEHAKPTEDAEETENGLAEF